MIVLPLSSTPDWALAAIIKLDIATPGLAGHYLRASDERRQVLAAYLAARHIDSEEASGSGELLMRADHRTILRTAFGHLPRGMRGALARSGTMAWGQDYYRSLFDILSNPAEGELASLIERLPALTGPKLKIAKMLPVDLRHARIIARLEDLDRANDLMIVTGLMERAGLDRQAFIRALLASSDESTSKVIERWTLKLPFPASPLPMTDAYRPIRSGAELRRAAISYRNCSRGYHEQALAGEVAIGEFTLDKESVLIHLDRRNGIWIFSSANGYRNHTVGHAINDAAKAYAATYGVSAKLKRSRKVNELQALRRLGGMPRSW